MRFTFSLLVAILLTLGCDSPATPNQSQVPASNPTEAEIVATLEASMTNAEMLATLGFSVTNFHHELVNGKDGTQETFRNDTQTVTIIRSLVTGVRVTARGEALNGSWHAGRHSDLHDGG